MSINNQKHKKISRQEQRNQINVTGWFFAFEWLFWVLVLGLLWWRNWHGWSILIPYGVIFTLVEKDIKDVEEYTRTEFQGIFVFFMPCYLYYRCVALKEPMTKYIISLTAYTIIIFLLILHFI